MRKFFLFLTVIGSAAAQNVIVRSKMDDDIPVNWALEIQTFECCNTQR